MESIRSTVIPFPVSGGFEFATSGYIAADNVTVNPSYYENMTVDGTYSGFSTTTSNADTEQCCCGPNEGCSDCNSIFG